MNSLKFGNVIVTFNRKKLLVEAVDSLLNQSFPIDRIIIVDNCSTDGTFDLLEKQGLIDNPRISYYRTEKNIGGSGGFAFGINKAKEFGLDWLTLSDDDAIYSPDYFSKIENAIKAYPDILTFTGTVKLEDERIQTTHRKIVNNWNTITTTNISTDMYKENFYLDLFTFVGVTISMNVIDKIGLPDKDYFIWWDDIEYSLRVRKYTQIMNISDAVILHKTKVISLDFHKEYKRDWREYYGWRNRIVTQRKHAKNKIAVNMYLIAWMLMKYLRICTSFYQGNRKYIMKLYTRAFGDAYKHNMGLNKYYLP